MKPNKYIPKNGDCFYSVLKLPVDRSPYAFQPGNAIQGGVTVLHSRRFGSKTCAEACSAVDIVPPNVDGEGLGGYKHEFESGEENGSGNYNEFPPTISPRPSSSTYYPTYLPSVTGRPTKTLGVVPEDVVGGSDEDVSVDMDTLPMEEIPFGDSTTSNIARKVKIYHDQNPEGILSVKEVQIYDVDGNNVALNGIASQSSDYSAEHTADKAIDGDLTTFSHTQSNGYNEWWEVDLGQNVAIDRIRITNRDCVLSDCLVRLSYAKMDLTDDSGTVVATRQFYDMSQMNVIEFSFDEMDGGEGSSVPQPQEAGPTYSPTYVPSVTAKPTPELPSAGVVLGSTVSFSLSGEICDPFSPLFSFWSQP